MRFGLLLVVLSAAPVKPEPIALDVGGQKVLDISPGSTPKVANAKVLEVKVVDDQLLLIGSSKGSSKLSVTSGDGEVKTYLVTVRPPDPKKIMAEVRELLGDIDGVTLVDRGTVCLQVDCEACNFAEEVRATQVAALFPCVRATHWLVPPRPADEVLAGVRKLLGEGPGQTEDLELDVVKGHVELSGELHTADDVRRVIAARAAFPELLVRMKLPAAATSDGGRR